MFISICPFSLLKTSRTFCVHTLLQAVLLGYCCAGWHTWAASFSCEDQRYLSCQHMWPSLSCIWLGWHNTWGLEWNKKDGRIRTGENKIRYWSRYCALPCPVSPKTKCLDYNNFAWLVKGLPPQHWDKLIKHQVKDYASSPHQWISQAQKPLKILYIQSETWATVLCLNLDPRVPDAQTTADLCWWGLWVAMRLPNGPRAHRMGLYVVLDGAQTSHKLAQSPSSTASLAVAPHGYWGGVTTSLNEGWVKLRVA